jgi:hypothetical protein
LIGDFLIVDWRLAIGDSPFQIPGRDDANGSAFKDFKNRKSKIANQASATALRPPPIPPSLQHSRPSSLRKIIPGSQIMRSAAHHRPPENPNFFQPAGPFRAKMLP